MKFNHCVKRYLFSLLLLLFAAFFLPQTVLAAKKPEMVKKLKCGVTTKNSINISWAPQNGVTGYQVFRSLCYDGPFEKIKEINAGTNSFCNLKLQNGREYYYIVRAYRGRGNHTVTGNFSKVLPARTRCASRTASVRSSANIRKHAGINHSLITSLRAGSKVTVICTANDKSGTAWSRISFKIGNKKKSGYIRSDLLSTGKVPKHTGVVIANSGLRLRHAASISSGIVTTLSKGAKVTILGQTTGTDGQKWYYVSAKQGSKTVKGYVSALYIRIN